MMFELLSSIGPGLAAVFGLAVLLGVAMGVVRAHLPERGNELLQQIDRCLPQIQCAQCGYPGCRPYAEALAGGAAINLCPPGGEQTIRELANLLGRKPLPLHCDLKSFDSEQVALIDEARCIGCTLCIKACPVDAIVGAHRFLHTVIAAHCTGCELCLAPCPVNCIDLVNLS